MWLYLSPLFLDDAALQFELCVVSTSFEEGLRQATCDNPLQEMEKKSLELELMRCIYDCSMVFLAQSLPALNPPSAWGCDYVAIS